MTTSQRALWLLLLMATIVGSIGSEFPQQMLLQHAPTVVVLATLPVVSRKFHLSTLAVGSIVAFMLLHVLGARYIYSYVPYDRWAEAWLGFNVSQHFEFRRNHFDRVVHFAFGVTAVRPVWEIFTGRFQVPPRFARYAAVEFVLAFSLVYELFEWGLTLVLSPGDAGAYNGEQGDHWDAHRDMSLALVGALVALLVWALARRRTPEPSA